MGNKLLNMKIFVVLVVSTWAAGIDKEALQKDFQKSFRDAFDEYNKEYTKVKKIGGKKTYVNKEKALALATSLSLTESDFDTSFNFCDKNGDGLVSTNLNFQKSKNN